MAEGVIKDLETGAILSYEDYMNKRRQTVTAQYDAAVNAAKTAQEEADAYAAAARTEAERVAGNVLNATQADIDAAYQRAQAGYGATAESLSRAGLTGSGYADNLARDAYASRASSHMTAQKTYSDAMQAAANAESKAVADAAAAYRTTVAAADQAKLAEEAKIDADAYTHRQEQAKIEVDLQALADQGAYSPGAIKSLAAAYGITGTALDNIMATANARAEGSKGALRDLVASTDETAATEADVLRATGVITPEEYDTLKTQWQNNVKTGAEVFTMADGQLLSQSDAQTIIDTLKSNKWAEGMDEKIADLQATFDSLYKHTGTAGKNNTTVTYTGGRDLSKAGRNFSVTAPNGDDDSYRYDLQSSGEVTDTRVVEAAAGYGDGQVFMLNDKLYVKKIVNGTTHVYGIEARGWASGKDNSYTKLLALFQSKTE